MNVSYYPGCALEGTAREYGESATAIAEHLGVHFQELPDWNCCGASSAHSTSDTLALALSARNVLIADKAGMDLVVPCAACFQRLKRAEKRLLDKAPIEGISGEYMGNFRIRYAIDFFWEEVGEKVVQAKVKKPLKGLSPVSYYGCLAMRPPHVTDASNHENPETMDNLVKTLGAEVKDWSYKTDCCGGSLTFTHPEVAYKLTKKLYDMAEEAGANCIVTACPLCLSNLDMGQCQISRENGDKYNLPIFYFTELMGLAFGKSAGKWLHRHMIDPGPLLQQKGLI